MPIVLRVLVTAALAMMVSGCETPGASEPGKPFSPFEPRLRQPGDIEPTIVESASVEYETHYERGPEVSIEGQVIDLLSGRLGDNLAGDELIVSFNNMPVPGFINEVFGEQLGLSFTIDNS